MPAMAWAASGISSISHWTRTTAVTTRLDPLEDHCHAHAPGDAEGGEGEGGIAVAELVGGREHDPGAGHADGVAERDGAALGVQLVVVELELAVAGQDLGGERFVQLDDVEVLQRESRLLEDPQGGRDDA